MYVDEHPDSTNGRYEYIDQTQETVVKQVTAGMLPEASVIVTVGFDLGEVKDNRVEPPLPKQQSIRSCYPSLLQPIHTTGATAEGKTQPKHGKTTGSGSLPPVRRPLRLVQEHL